MSYLGLQSQIWRNNLWSNILLLAFPMLILILVYLFFFILNFQNIQDQDQVNKDCLTLNQTSEQCILDENGKIVNQYKEEVNNQFRQSFPWITTGVALWFLIAYFSHSRMINRSVGSKPLNRKESPDIYNLLENLCIAQGVKMPKLQIIEDSSLNAFASGINDKTYTITLSRGIIEKLNKEELEAVMAHELGHIINKDTKLLIISIIFVGIFSFLSEFFLRMLFHSRGGSDSKKSAGPLIIALGLAAIGFVISILIRFSLSRKREFLADAFSAKATKNPLALANALKKISGDPVIEALTRKDLAQAFIENPKAKSGFFSNISGLFSTHPKIQKRIAILEQF